AHGAEHVYPVAVYRRRRAWADGIDELQTAVVGLPLMCPYDLPGSLVESQGALDNLVSLYVFGVGDEDPALGDRRAGVARGEGVRRGGGAAALGAPTEAAVSAPDPGAPAAPPFGPVVRI